MAFTYEDVNPTLIENTTMRKRLRDGVDYQYLITANSGYVLHDTNRDYELFDEIGDPVLDENGEQIIKQGFTRATATCAANYDFTANPREFFAVLESEVPADQIFTVPNGEHETI